MLGIVMLISTFQGKEKTWHLSSFIRRFCWIVYSFKASAKSRIHLLWVEFAHAPCRNLTQRINIRGINAESTDGEVQDAAAFGMNLDPNSPWTKQISSRWKPNRSRIWYSKLSSPRTQKQHLEFQWRKSDIMIHERKGSRYTYVNTCPEVFICCSITWEQKKAHASLWCCVFHRT